MKNKGITLIALVLTTIVLIILSGISISLVTGQNGILANAKMAKEMSETSSEKEALQLAMTFANMENNLSNTNKYYLGTPLCDQTLENGDKWNIVINNETLEKYGTGWNYIEKNTQIPNYGITNYSWVVNYSKAETVQIGENCTNLSYKNSLAVTDDLVLNIDATNLESENWGDITKHGDVKYSKENKSLYFDGDGDYLELTKNADFSNGFTFEIYANLERLRYDNGSLKESFGLFCKMPTIYSNFYNAMRFGYAYDNTICRFSWGSLWNGSGKNLETTSQGEIKSENLGIEIFKDFYLTFVYKRYNNKREEWDESADRIEYYINGILVGYTYYGIDSYNEGCAVWNIDNAPFFLGVCPWSENGNLYYLKGNVYCTRLYERALSQEEVTNNVTKTKLYRQMK